MGKRWRQVQQPARTLNPQLEPSRPIVLAARNPGRRRHRACRHPLEKWVAPSRQKSRGQVIPYAKRSGCVRTWGGESSQLLGSTGRNAGSTLLARRRSNPKPKPKPRSPNECVLGFGRFSFTSCRFQTSRHFVCAAGALRR